MSYPAPITGRIRTGEDSRLQPQDGSRARHTGRNLRITTPMRTACDIALLTPGELNEHDACDVLCALFEEYQVSLAQCMQTLDDNHFWPNTQPARELFTSMKHFF